ncbi:MAG: glycosyltransferase, partial [Patescibacteria group bacterium]
IKKDNKDILFVVIGDGPEKHNLESMLLKYDLAEDFLIFTNIKKMAYEYLKAFDIFVLPSQKEGFPYALLEAGLAKLPLITTNVGGISDLANYQNSIMIMSREPEQIKKAIYFILENKERGNNISEVLHKDVIEKFTLKEMTEKTKKVYED